MKKMGARRSRPAQAFDDRSEIGWEVRVDLATASDLDDLRGAPLHEVLL
jgi:hypothetical protein